MNNCYPWTTASHGQALSMDALTVIAEHCQLRLQFSLTL